MNLPEFLEKREKELVAEINELRRALLPREAELAQVRRAKVTIAPIGNAAAIAAAAIGIRGVNALGADYVHTALSRADTPLAISAALNRNLLFNGPDPYRDLTMKQLVLKALSEHFPNGGTTRQLIDFFREAWGRDIERTNLSPQISRLYQEGTIGRAQGRKEWHLMRRPDIVVGFQPFFAVHTNEVLWMEPNLARPGEHLPITTQEPASPDPDDD